jgi:hypothetical protein
VLEEEMQGAMEISSISCKRFSPGDTVEGTFYDFEVYLAQTELESLGSEFDENWVAGTRELVFQRDSLTLTNSPDQWVEFDLDAPYWYDGTQNLVFEFLWSSAETEDACMYSWHWDAGSIRSVNGGYADSTGTLSSLVLMLEIEGELALDGATFGGIKVLLGSGDD